MAVMGQGCEKAKQTEKHLSFWRLVPGRQLRTALGLAIVPTLFFLVAFQLTKVSGPTWLSNNFENNYPYLFNSLLLIKGHPASWIDHPGTTTQIFGAAILRFSEAGSSDKIVEAVLDNPDKFIKRIQRNLLIFVTATLWLFPWLTALRAGYFQMLLLQVPSLFFVTLLKYTTWFSSDLMLVPWCVAGLCLAVELTRLRFSGKTQTRAATLAGIVCALGIFTKLTFFPILLILFVACRGFRTRLIASVSCLLTAAAVALPIYPRLGTLISWWTDLMTHTGGYATGDAGFTTPDLLWQGARMLVTAEPMILWLPLLTSVLVLILLASPTKTGAPREQPLMRTALALLSLQVVGFILVAKHAGPHYLIPILLSTGLNLVLLYEAIRLQNRFSPSACFGALALTAILIWTLAGSIGGTATLFHSLGLWRKDQLSMYHRVLKLSRDELRIDYYRSSTPEFAAFFGNAYTQYLFDNGYRNENYFGPLLQKRYPKAMFTLFFTPDMEFYTFTRELSPDALAAGRDRFYFFGNHSDGRFDKDHLMPIPGLDPKDMNEVDSGGYIYLDEWTRSEVSSK
jgi:hypothetical protein